MHWVNKCYVRLNLFKNRHKNQNLIQTEGIFFLNRKKKTEKITMSLDCHFNELQRMLNWVILIFLGINVNIFRQNIKMKYVIM